MGLKVFLFHRISPVTETWAPAMHPYLFEKTVRHILKKSEVATVEDVMGHSHNYDLRKNIACITFDDGFRDNIEYAAPILKKFRCPASFYIVTDCADRNVPPWTHVYSYLFLKTSANSLAIESDQPDLNFKKTFRSSSERINFARTFFLNLKALPYDKVQSIMDQVKNNFSDVTIPGGY